MKILAEETALASPALVHQGKTPYDVAKERGQQKVLSLLYPVPQQAIFQVFTSVKNLHIERDQVKGLWHQGVFIDVPLMAVANGCTTLYEVLFSKHP